MCLNAWPWPQQLSWWMCQLLFGHLNGLLMELLPLSYQDSRHGSLCSCLELTSTCVLIGITTTPPKAALDLLEKQIAVSIISYWQLHCLLETQCSRTTPTKARLNALICEQVLSDNDFLRNLTQNHKLVITEDKSEPTQVSEGQKTPRVDLSSMHEEADIFLTQQAIHIAKDDPESTVSVVSDDTDVFALLPYFYWSENLQSTIKMQSPIKGRPCIDIKKLLAYILILYPQS